MTDSNETTPRYLSIGSVTGWCGHRHLSEETAEKCADKHDRSCRSLGGGAYSDRRVIPAEECTQRRDGGYYLPR